MNKPLHIRPDCRQCGHPLRPHVEIFTNADSDEWVCGREWDPAQGGGGRCDGLYLDYNLAQFQEALGDAMGLEWWEENRARP